MKKGYVDKKISFSIVFLYVFFGVSGWFIGGILYVFIGLLLVFLIDEIFPKWAYDLTWEDIELALDNLGKYGATGSHMSFKIKNRKFFIYRDANGKKGILYRYALRIPLKHWEDIYNLQDIEDIYKSIGGMRVINDCKGLECYSCFPRNNLEDCKKVLKKFINAVSADIREDVFARVDFAKKNVWIKYDDDITEEEKKELLAKRDQQQKEDYKKAKQEAIIERNKKKEKERKRKEREKIKKKIMKLKKH